MGVVNMQTRFVPRSTEGQMIAVLAASLVALFAVLMVLEIRKHESAIETAQSERTLERLRSVYPVVLRAAPRELPALLEIISSCHAGYTVTHEPFARGRPNADTATLRSQLARALSLDHQRLLVAHARLTRDDFSYRKCPPSDLDLPIDGIVISAQFPSGHWLNVEVHPHEWHFQEKVSWILRAGGAFIFVGGIAIFFMRRMNRPLNSLTRAARRFGEGLRVSPLAEQGPVDLRRAIRSFNMMQLQVADEVTRRTNTLAAISHDVRTPLTALRLKAELIDDEEIRRDLTSSIERMERITASALDFLRGECRTEPLCCVDLSALLESECVDFEDTGRNVVFLGEQGVHHTCRPDALARALRNLIDNAVNYGNGAEVALRVSSAFVEILVSDHGPGIPAEKVDLVVEPFQRLSSARERHEGGFGLGLAVVKAVAEGHGGHLVLTANQPSGLVATIRLPVVIAGCSSVSRHQNLSQSVSD